MSVKQVIQNLKNIQNSMKDVDYLFIDKSLNWILNKANENLDQRTKHFWGSEARSWTKKIYATYGILENNDMNSASIEFGIGRIGQNNPQASAIMNNYEYNTPSEYKDKNGNWTFKDVRTGIWVSNFGGYVGKSFLYDAFTEYMFTSQWTTLYQQAFDEIMRKVIR